MTMKQWAVVYAMRLSAGWGYYVSLAKELEKQACWDIITYPYFKSVVWC